MKYFPIVLASVSLLLPSCKTTPDDFTVAEGKEYFPLEIGKHIIYQVDSTIFDPTGEDTTVFFSKTLVKEEIVDTLRDNNDELLFKIERFERSADTLPWQIAKVFTQQISSNQAIRTEDNLRFIKLTFPIRENETWNGNIHFDPSLIVTVAGETLEMFKGWRTKISSVGEPETVGDFSFPEVVAVSEAESENLIELRTAVSKYAKGIGLIYRELWILDTQCIDACIGQAWDVKAEKGFILRQQIISHN